MNRVEVSQGDSSGQLKGFTRAMTKAKGTAITASRGKSRVDASIRQHLC